MTNPEPDRCHWARQEPETTYHDQEWGVPQHDDSTLFEFLILEGAQAGLSWSTILKKREGYRDAYRGFDIAKVARFTPADVARLLGDERIVRNRLKVDASIDNARAALTAIEAFGTLDAFLWRYVDGAPVQNAWTQHQQVPASTPASDAMSKDLKKRGFRFVGSTICYAFMQAVGMVNDHLVSCHRYDQVMSAETARPAHARRRPA
ncbi:MAG: DNA-3-methyladenine glycosylase I [Planctomycetota bacterium]|nr:DNA-3-methyladenine glycosylase I [Planctomycetota bacterium]